VVSGGLKKIVLTLWRALLSVTLHCDMSIKVVERTIRLFATIPATLVHALDLLVSPARSLVLLSSRNWYKRVNLIRALLWCIGWRAVHVTWSYWGRAVATIACPVWPRLGIHATARVGIPVSHVGVGTVR
jgi:hypothetical protein